MKVFQVLNGKLHWLTPYRSISDTTGRFAANIKFIELPDDTLAREQWIYDEQTGDVSHPPCPDGWDYDTDTGTFYNIAEKNKEPYITEIASLKEELAATDYKIIKCSECQLTGQDMPYDIASLHTERQALRDRINELETTLAGLEA